MVSSDIELQEGLLSHSPDGVSGLHQADDIAYTSIEIQNPPAVSASPSPSLVLHSPAVNDASLPTANVPPASSSHSSSTALAHTGQPGKQTRRSKRSEIWEWNIELLACAIFVAFLIALAVTLHMRNGRPLPNWSINSILSFYTVVFKGALVFVIGAAMSQNQWRWFRNEQSLHDIAKWDSAARDPVGAAYWLFHKGVAEPVTALGAIILIAAVLVDPFVQQLVQYENCSTNATQSALMPRTNLYTPRCMHSGPLSCVPLPPELSTWTGGMYSPPDAVVPVCSSGNCTFDAEYSTIGFCSRCEDLSQDLKKRTSPSHLEHCKENTTLSLQSGLSLRPYCYDTQGSETGGQPLLAAGHVSKPTKPDLPYEIIAKAGSCISRDYGPGIGITPCRDSCGNATHPAEPWRCRGYGAAACTIGPCIKTYNANMTNGVLKETLIHQTGPGEHWDANTNPRLRALVDLQCGSQAQKDWVRNSGLAVGDDARWRGLNVSMVVLDALDSPIGYCPTDDTKDEACLPVLDLLKSGCVYAYDQTFMTAFQSSVLSDLTGRTNGFLDAPTTISSYNGPQILQHVYNFGNLEFERIDAIFHNASTAFTNHIRKTGNENFSAPAVGLVSEYAVCVQIEWLWLLMPGFLAVLTIILLLICALLTWLDGAPVWKSSPLAFMLHCGIGSSRAGTAPSSQQSGTSPVPQQTVSAPNSQQAGSTSSTQQPGPTTQSLPNRNNDMKRWARTILVQMDYSETSIRLLQTNAIPLPSHWWHRKPKS
ncbi:hypothetical protein BU24DRAFT_420637 [Aaosphaeria arxii CBS 175.79]|uniref:Uncharacterized protein n=1 Tax=Aaosphaeria arxii CBS 175.79 TaxID=1450172 RepID=A0A6A5XXC4_9PLEO|nr:uncharacterized protein BU24DRAFT_420637 [Aaosphaeria arxii CBS 175.79]KAF2017596.1 hypothetical protein BU24DRAFT_420637 [Aaosphaeria arxii CBS 175.79]